MEIFILSTSYMIQDDLKYSSLFNKPSISRKSIHFKWRNLRFEYYLQIFLVNSLNQKIMHILQRIKSVQWIIFRTRYFSSFYLNPQIVDIAEERNIVDFFCWKYAYHVFSLRAIKLYLRLKFGVENAIKTYYG